MMKDKLLKLAGHSFVYGVGNALGAVGGFILIPLYTHVLSTGEYGVLELLNRTADILMLFMLMGQQMQKKQLNNSTISQGIYQQ